MSRERAQRRLAAILAADVVGYSRLMERDEEGTRERFNDLLGSVIEPQVVIASGRIFKTIGDGVLVEFPSAIEAARSALTIQAAVSHYNSHLAQEQHLVFRMGINVGDVIIEGEDVHGDGVNVAARLEGICEPGEVYVSGSVHDQVDGKVGATFKDLGEHRFKNLSRPVGVFHLIPQGKSNHQSERNLVNQGALDRPSVACLPFRNLGETNSQEFPADAIRLAIQASLVLIPGLFVIAPPVMNKYRDQDISPVQVGEELNVRYILEGACQQLDKRIRISVQLMDTSAGRIVWANQYDRDVADTLKTQDEITAQIIATLDIKYLSGNLRTTLTNLNALHAFYRGLSLFYGRTKEDSDAAKKEFESVYRLQPDAGVGPAFLCMLHLRDAQTGWAESKNNSLMEAVRWAERAVQFETNDGLGHLVLACIHLINHRYEEAVSTCRKALEVRPNCPMAHSNLANILHYCGESAEAITLMEEAIRIAPVHPSWFQVVLASAYREVGRLDSSISAAHKGTQIDAKDIGARLVLCSSLEGAGFLTEARDAARDIMELDPNFSLATFAETQPYKDERVLHRILTHLREAGLPG